MGKIKEILGKLPGLKVAWYALRRQYYRRRLKEAGAEKIFTDIFKKNLWKGTDSLSGPGSDLDQTRVLVRELPLLWRELNVTTVLDIPCGDFHWMRQVDLDGIRYCGADIVAELIQQNRDKYGKENVLFQVMNLIEEALPQVDLILCRDCLVHLSFADIFPALQNLCHSQSKYLLTTTFTDHRKNYNILTGMGRPLNLQAPPFNFPTPLRVINEECTEIGGGYRDKSLGLWKIETLVNILENSSQRQKLPIK